MRAALLTVLSGKNGAVVAASVGVVPVRVYQSADDRAEWRLTSEPRRLIAGVSPMGADGGAVALIPDTGTLIEAQKPRMRAFAEDFVHKAGLNVNTVPVAMMTEPVRAQTAVTGNDS